VSDGAFNAAEIGLALVRRWLVETMGEDDARVKKWDELCAAFWRDAP
jgi:hypothetical protein